MSDLRRVLIQAYQAGQFLEAVSEALSPNEEERTVLVSELTTLHNERLINIVEGFVELSSKSKSGVDFFLLRHVFEKVLPQLEAPTSEVLRCVLQLYRDAGVDLAAGTILDAFLEFCSKQSTRPKEALVEIEASPDLLADLLVPTLVAGSHVNLPFYLDETVRFCQHHNIEFRRRALLALGRLSLEDGTKGSELVMSTLERAVETDADDQMLAIAIRSAFALLQQDATNEARYVAAIARALSSGNEYALHAASEIFGFRTNDLPPQLLQIFLDHLRMVNPANKGTLDKIDYGISHLLEGPHADRGILFLEDLLLAHFEGLTLKAFDSTARTIRHRAELRSKVFTRWLFRGDHPLCEGLEVVIGVSLDGFPEIEIDTGELVSSDPTHFFFAARKAVGYLFSKPISAASFLISLMRHSLNDMIVQRLGELLFDPLLINFSGNLRDYIAQRVGNEEGRVREALGQSLRSLDEYLEGLRSVGDIPAFYSSEARRETYRRHISQVMAESFKSAEAGSVILQLVHKSILLYGRKSIHYVYGSEGGSNRMEIPLHSHGTEIEVPRMTILDPHGLDFILRVFRHERLTA